MSLFMLQFEPDMPRLIRWARSHKVLPRESDDDLGYTIHAVLAASFGMLAPKPFSLQLRPDVPKILAYSAIDAAALRDHALEFALPDALVAVGLDRLAAKPMPANFEVGRELGFLVRVRPMIRTDRQGNRARSKEIDAFQAAFDNREAAIEISRARVYNDWLTQRMAQGGCAVHESLTLSGLRRSVIFRRDSDRGLRRIGGKDGGPDATFTGTLKVTDSGKFSELLARGVGRHRAFGFGMILLRPA